MQDLLTALAQKNFLIVGRAGMDFYADPPGAKTEDATQFVTALGGSSANIGVALTRHGSRAALVTSVADDSIGRYCLNQLAHYEVDATHVKSVGGEARNSLAVIESRVEDHQSVIYRNGAADFEMTKADIDAVDFTQYAALITTGTVFAAEPSRSAAFHAFDKAKAAGLPIIFDLDYRPYSWPSAKVASDVYSRAGALCDVVIGNDDEFGFMAGDYTQGLAKARDLAKNTAQLVVYKRGELGAITITPTDEFQTGIYAVTALKPTGAGDAFMGGLIASLANGFDLKTAVLRGSASAAIVVSNIGCAPAMPTTPELDAFLKSHPGVSTPE
jgi:5-dehydro-2-deoxygluconokinase